MLNAIQKNLERGVILLNHITDEQYRDTSVAPYYSSIGGHMRHVLDVFDCIFEGLHSKKINLINRKRDILSESYTKNGIDYFNEIMDKCVLLKTANFNDIVEVTDNLGMGVVSVNYTLGAILIQAHSHAIHHFASVGYVISQLGIELPDDDFGFNPSTPKKATK